jgi:hypothetical protein
MKSIEEFLIQIERRGKSTPSHYPSSLNHACNSIVPIEVLRASGLSEWQFFPLLTRGRFAAQKALVENATSDQEQLEKWAAEYPGCTFALATGKASGVFTIEVKGELGRNSLRFLAWDDWDWWQQTLLMSAGNDADHGFFRWPAEFSTNKASKQIAPGLCLRGEKDFVLIPPASVSGISCAWLNPGMAVAEVPRAVLSHILAISEKQASWKNVSQFAKPQSSAPSLRSVTSFGSSMVRQRISH